MSNDSSVDAPLMLSVSGMRGIVNASFTDERVNAFAFAFGAFVKQRTGHAQPNIVLGRDSRPSGERFANAAAQGLISAGCSVTHLGIVATPTVAVMVTHRKAHGGMVVTASHNPGEWNGLKTLSSDGAAPPKADADEIIRRFRELPTPSMTNAPGGQTSFDNAANDVHLARVLAAIDPEPIRKAKFRVALDSVCGAGGPAGRMLLDALGCDVVHLNSTPDGNFPHSPEPTEANLTDLAKQTKANNAHVGFAQDPDADRLAIIDETGTYIGEEYTLALAAWRVLDIHAASSADSSAFTSRDRKGADSGVPVFLAANLSTSRMIDDIAARFPGSRVLRTAVGEANVVAAMQSHGALLGGEGNGGVILPGVCFTRDSLSAMALTLSLMAERRQPVSALVQHTPRYVMIKQKFDLPTGRAALPLRDTLKRVEDHFSSVEGARLNNEDGLRIDFADSWVHLRGSNTEPIVRLIAEAKTSADAESLINTVAQHANLR